MGRARCLSLRTLCLGLGGLASLAWLQGLLLPHTSRLDKEEMDQETPQNKTMEGEAVQDKVAMISDSHLVERQVAEEPEGVPWIVNSTQVRLWMGELDI